MSGLRGKSQLIAVTGAGGMLGRDVAAETVRRNAGVAALERSDLDVTDEHSCLAVLRRLAPAAVIHCAAFTDVNRAETEPEAAMLVNAHAAGNVARACADIGARLIAVSTDYVFDGAKPLPYLETDAVCPLNAYGRSKLEGERLALAAAPELCAVARTSWLYGRHGKNFVTTMLAAARSGRSLSVVADQTGSPTYTGDLARALVDLAQTPEASGVFHVTNSEACSWFEFARVIFELTGVVPAGLKPVLASEFPSPATRPQNSRLANTRLTRYGIAPLPPWRDALSRYLEEIGELRPGIRVSGSGGD